MLPDKASPSPQSEIPLKGGPMSSGSPSDSRSSNHSVHSQALFDTIYRSHILRCMIECSRKFGKRFGSQMLRDLVQILSDLVHMSNKFAAQLMDCKGLECLGLIGLLTYRCVSRDDIRFENEDGLTYFLFSSTAKI